MPLLETFPIEVVIQMGALQLALLQFSKVRELIPTAYLDEVFHIPQAQAYCQAALKGDSFVSDVPWDPKITTPPGLYILAQTYVQNMPKALFDYLGVEDSDVCGVQSLRTINLIGVAAILPLVITYIQRVRKSDSPYLTQAGTLLPLITFPLLFFFSSLFYTDVWSTIFVIMSLAVVLAVQGTDDKTVRVLGRAYAAAMAGISIFFRQTNILWAGYVAVTALEQEHRPRMVKVEEKKRLAKEKKEAELQKALQERKKLSEGATKDMFAGYKKAPKVKYQPRSISEDIVYAPDIVQFFVTAILNPSITVPFGLVAVGFGLFVYDNGGIALGDKENHQVTVNIAQIFHFALHVLFFTGPVFLFGHIQAYWKYIKSNPLGFITNTLAVGFLAHVLTGAAHPFTLADNRHFTFYIWRRLIEPTRESLPFALLVAGPLYHTGLWLLWPREETDLDAAKDPRYNFEIGPTAYTRLFWTLAVVGTLVPSPLLEPRYYILPFIMWRARHYRPAETKLQPVVETLWYVAINAGVAYLFLYRPFAWDSEPGALQRFMW